METVDILGTHISAASFQETQDLLAHCVATRSSVMFSAATVYSVMLGRELPDYQEIVNQADYVMADGMPLVWVSRKLRYEAERVHGDDFMLSVCKEYPQWRHYLLGGKLGQPEIVAEELRRRYPGINIAGIRATPTKPMPDSEARQVIEDIHQTQADVVWVGMGTPAQDYWMHQWRHEVGRPLLGVGSAFNLMAGLTKPAPEWMKRSGLQWVHRWLQEPRRLTKRYLIYNPLFIWQVLRQLLKSKKQNVH